MRESFTWAGARSLIGAIAVLLIIPVAYADDADDVRAVINAYISTETDLEEQAKLMTDDRTYIVGGTRHTDNVANMRGHIAGQELNRTLDPDGKLMVTMEDLLIRVNGDTAVASFYRYWNYIPGAEAVRAGRDGNAPGPQASTVVLAKDGRDWKIVHTHISPMGGN